MREDDTITTPTTSEALPAPVAEGVPPEIRRMVILALLLTVPATVGSFAWWGLSGALGALVGAGIAVPSFWMVGRAVVKLTAQEGAGAGRAVAAIVVKLLLLLAMTGTAVLLLQVDALGLLVGASVVVVAIVLATIVDLMV